MTLYVVFPGDLRQFAQCSQLGELRLVVGVCDAARPQPVTEREGHVILRHQLAHLVKVRVEEILLVVGQAPRRHDRPSPADDAGLTGGGQRHVAQQHPGVHGDVVHTLLELFDERVTVDLPGQFLRP
jgi:hypothetical protein